MMGGDAGVKVGGAASHSQQTLESGSDLGAPQVPLDFSSRFLRFSVGKDLCGSRPKRTSRSTMK